MIFLNILFRFLDGCWSTERFSHRNVSLLDAFKAENAAEVARKLERIYWKRFNRESSHTSQFLSI